MRTISISDEAWAYLKEVQVSLMRESGRVQSIGVVASRAILNNVKGEVKP
jgi:hypothetical protein